MILVGAAVVVFGIGGMTSDPYDSGRLVHIVFGLFVAIPGLALAYAGFRLIRRS
jgi:hypothetical protein